MLSSVWVLQHEMNELFKLYHFILILINLVQQSSHVIHIDLQIQVNQNRFHIS